PAIDYGLSIDEDLELAIVTANHLDLDPQLATQPGRHPGGMQPGDSVGTIPNSDPTHDDLQRILGWLGLAPEDLPDAPLVPFGSPVGIISDEWSVKPWAAPLGPPGAGRFGGKRGGSPPGIPPPPPQPGGPIDGRHWFEPDAPSGVHSERRCRDGCGRSRCCCASGWPSRPRRDGPRR